MTHGWIIIDKPQGMTSTRVVSIIKRIFKVKKAGHGGTLDPLATGVLPIALGEATKTLSYILDGKKAYSFTIQWGESRSTDDKEGEITATSSKRPSLQEIKRAIPTFLGQIQQVPPAYSALKIKGERAYTLARQGKEVCLAPRQVEIESLSLISSSVDSACFEVFCSKGTYVRSLARDLALHLGTYGHIIELRRLRAGPFHEKNAILLDSLREIGHNTELIKYVLPLQDALADILALELEDMKVAKLRQGQSIPFVHEGVEGVALVLCGGVPQALTNIREGRMAPIRVFNMN